MNQRFSYNANTKKVVWVDLDNSPHVPFFAPIIHKLREQGYTVKISARKYSQTVALANLYNLDYSTIGKHHGKNKFIKVIGLIYRSIQLLPFALKSRATIAISHGSRSQMIVAQLLRIPIVMFLDYEYIQTIPFVKPSLVFIPNLISKEKLKYLSPRIDTYPGIKEDIYVPTFTPDSSIRNKMNISSEDVVVILRPPAHEAHYHNPESEKFFDEIIHYLAGKGSLRTVILPRDNKQKESILKQFKNYFDIGSLIIPSDVVDGLNLMWHSDLVISGGGTMNREAAALGVPVYSIFKGKIGDVDNYLSKSGRLVLVDNIEDIKNKIKIEKRNKVYSRENLNSLALQSIVNSLESFIAEKSDSQNIQKSYSSNDKKISKRRASKI
jgi:predicted glycosyltransferase